MFCLIALQLFQKVHLCVIGVKLHMNNFTVCNNCTITKEKQKIVIITCCISISITTCRCLFINFLKGNLIGTVKGLCVIICHAFTLCMYFIDKFKIFDAMHFIYYINRLNGDESRLNLFGLLPNST